MKRKITPQEWMRIGRHKEAAMRRRVVSRRRRTADFGVGRLGMGRELKFHDVDLDDTTVEATGAVTNSINLIAQGVTETTRIGRKCTIRSIGWRFRWSISGTTDENSTSDIGRVIMYVDKQANGATAAVTDILKSADFQSFNNLNNKGRFRVLIDRTYSLVIPSGGTSAAGVDQFGEMVLAGTFFKKVNIPIEFSSTAGAITEIRSNNIGVLLISGTGVCGFASKIRLRFEG